MTIKDWEQVANDWQRIALEACQEKFRLIDDCAELRRQLQALEIELIRQTGCRAEEVKAVYNVPVSKPVVNARMGEALRARFDAEDRYNRLLDLMATNK